MTPVLGKNGPQLVKGFFFGGGQELLVDFAA